MAESIFKEVSVEARKTPDKMQAIRKLTDRYQRYEDFHQMDLSRYSLNSRFLWGINYGQWPAHVVASLLDEGRSPPQFNILWDKAKTFTGAILNNQFEPRYAPVQGKIDSLCLKMEDMYYSDKSLMEWDKSTLRALLDSTCGVGYERMIVSDRFDPFGHIGFEACDPTRILVSPIWRSDDIYKLQDYFTWDKMSVDDIFNTFPNHSPRLKELREREKRDNINYGINTGTSEYQTAGAKWGDRHLVYEFHYIERKTREWEYDKKNRCPFPETDETYHSAEDKAQKLRYIHAMGLSTDDIIFIEQTTVTKYIKNFCPSIDGELWLADGKDVIQCGHVNLFPLGIKHEGSYVGLVDDTIDVQRAYNKVQLDIQEQITRDAKGGGLIDGALANGDKDKQDEIIEARNKPGTWVFTEEGATSGLGTNNGMIPFQRTGVQTELWGYATTLEKQADKFSHVPAVLESKAESSKESAKMMDIKAQTALISQRVYNSVYEAHEKDKASAYASQAKHTYSGVSREFSARDGNSTIVINNKKTGEDGRCHFEDDISVIPDMKVTMVPSKRGNNLRSQLTEEYDNLLKVTAQNPTLVLPTLIALKAKYELQVMPEDTKAELDKAFDLVIDNAAKAELIKSKQLSAALNPQQPQAGAQAQVAGAEKKAGAPQPGLGDGGEVPQQQSEHIPTEEETKRGTPQQK
jgi:hypothetical protein